jgi:hypothetical protein
MLGGQVGVLPFNTEMQLVNVSVAVVRHPRSQPALDH